MQSDVLGKISNLMDEWIRKVGSHIFCEAMLPNFINKLLHDKTLEIELLMTDAKWCGVTFKEDIPLVKSIVLSD